MGLVKDDLSSMQKSLSFLKEVLEDLCKAEDDGKPSDNWKPSFKYEPHHEKAVKEYTSKGFSHREAAHMSGVDPAKLRYDDNKQRWNTGHRASELSDPMLQLAKMVAKKHMDRHQTERGQKAMENVQSAPGVAEHHHAKQVIAGAAGDWDTHLKNLKASGTFEGLKPHEVAKTIMQHKKDFYAQNADKVADKQSEVASKLGDYHNQALDAAATHRVESMRSILQGGQGAPAEAGSQYTEQPDVEFEGLSENEAYTPDYDTEEEDR